MIQHAPAVMPRDAPGLTQCPALHGNEGETRNLTFPSGFAVARAEALAASEGHNRNQDGQHAKSRRTGGGAG